MEKDNNVTVQDSNLDANTVKAYLATENGQDLLNSLIDSKVTKGIETWKKNNLKKFVDDEVSKRYPDETPEQKRIKELEMEFEKARTEAKREKLLNLAYKEAQQENIPTDFLDRFLGEDEETTLNNIKSYSNVFKNAVKINVESKFKENGREITKTEGSVLSKPDFSKMSSEEFKKLSPEQIETYYKNK
jgi:hypothetical protein